MLFISYLFSDPQIFLMHIMVVMFSVCCHEYAHAQMALWQGDATAAEQGHLTLNPLKQMGIFPIIILAVVGLTWGRVPVNPHRMRHRYSDALVSFAGPFMNLILFTIFCVAFSVSYVQFDGSNTSGKAVLTLLSTGAQLNMALFLLNMMPIPSLDGWYIYSYFFPKMKQGNSELINGMSLFLFMGVVMGGKYLFLAAEKSMIIIVDPLVRLFG